MGLPAVRRRFCWPADDIVTGNVRIDSAVDRVLRRTRGLEPVFRIEEHDPLAAVAVVGFPRSANTLLTSWLTRVVRPHVTVIDGRHSHSSLDVQRMADAGIPVIVPVRHPVDACASMLVRMGQQDSPARARDMLRAYAAWHRIATKMASRHNVVIARFDDIVTDPARIAQRWCLREVVDFDRVAESDLDSVIEQTRDDLTFVVGQGLPENGIPAHLMISLPEPARQPELEHARGLLREETLYRERAVAEATYEELSDLAVWHDLLEGGEADEALIR